MFGELGQLGYLVQNLAGLEPKLDRVPRLRLNEMVETVQDLEGTSKIATYNLVQASKIQHSLIFEGSFWYLLIILRLLVAGDI